MICPSCGLMLAKNGKSRQGNQRYRCSRCRYNWTEEGNGFVSVPRKKQPLSKAERNQRWKLSANYPAYLERQKIKARARRKLMKLFSNANNPILWVKFVDNMPQKVSLTEILERDVVSGNVLQLKVYIDQKYGNDALFKFLDLVVAL